MHTRPTLIVLGGLPGVGKTTLARELAQRTAALHLRIDAIEQALRESSTFSGEIADAGYRIAYAVAQENLRPGRMVIADCVNPIALTRQAWRAAGERSGARVLEVEVICSDRAQHEQRVKSRTSDIANLVLPTWPEVESRDYEPWAADLTLDTAQRSIAQNIESLLRLARYK